jgi:hypothetical protein
MKLFKKRRVQPKTRIVVHVEKIKDTTPAFAVVRSVVQTPRWDIRREEFRGFDSPPGRF